MNSKIIGVISYAAFVALWLIVFGMTMAGVEVKLANAREWKIITISFVLNILMLIFYELSVRYL